jgi:hypothetical protein
MFTLNDLRMLALLGVFLIVVAVTWPKRKRHSAHLSTNDLRAIAAYLKELNK